MRKSDLKRTLLAVSFLLTSFCCFSQTRSSMGYITEEEAKMKECSFDKEASAIVLIDEGHTDHDNMYNMVSHYYRKIKILKETGIKYGEIEIRFRSDEAGEDISGLEILVSNFDENGSVKQVGVDKKSIYRKKINNTWSRVAVAVPEIKVGSIIEYKYRHTSKSYAYLRDWYFQEDIPVAKSMFTLKMVPHLEMQYLVQRDPRFEIQVKPEKKAGSVYFEMKEIPGLGEEPFMDAREDYVQKVMFQVTKYATRYGSETWMSNWNEVTKNMMSRQDFGRQLKVNISEAALFVNLLEGKSDIEKIKAIHSYVISSVKWNGVNSRTSADGVRELWKNKSGNSGSINLSLVNLLQKAGLKAYPVLVSERGHGQINKQTPFIDQFNNVYAVVMVDNRNYYLDGTNLYTPLHLTPYEILNSTVFIVDDKNGGLVDIKEDKARYHDIVFNKAELHDDGSIVGVVNLLNKDYARRRWVREYKGSDKDEYINKRLLQAVVNVSVDSFQVENVDIDSLALKQKFNFKTALQNTGDYYFINLNMFTGYENNPFLTTNRFSRVNFGYLQTMNLTCDVRLSSNFQVDALPENIKLKNAEGTVVFTRELFFDKKDNHLVARIKVDINKSLFEVQDYSALQEFYKKMIDLLNEQVVLKKI